MTNVQVALPLGHARPHVVVIPLAVGIRSIALPTHKEKDGLIELSRRAMVCEQARVPDADTLDARVPDLGVGLDAAAAPARGDDARGIDVGEGAAAGVAGDEVDRVGHHLGRGAAAAAGGAACDDEDAVRGDLREEGGDLGAIG